MKRKEMIIRQIVLVMSLLCALGTFAVMLSSGTNSRRLLAAATVMLLLLPHCAEKFYGCRISLPAYLFYQTYMLAAMCGQCWDFYYHIAWWDKLLHVCGGVLFAVIGGYLFTRMEPQSQRPWMAAVFGLLFSMAVAVLWEFVEYAMDRFGGMDMQNDTVITGFCSYLLGTEPGKTNTLENITSVLVNGVPLPVDGYLDIGLHDTMLDLLLGTLGAVVVCLIQLLDQGRHLPIRPADSTEA